MPLTMPRSFGVAGWLVPPPVRAPPRISQISARPEPLCAPKGSSAPRGPPPYICAGSVVGVPVWSISAPSGTGFPAAWATCTLPMAMALVAKSRIRAAPPGAVGGMAMQTGLVPKRGWLPRKGATTAGPVTALTKWIESRPAAVAGRHRRRCGRDGARCAAPAARRRPGAPPRSARSMAWRPTTWPKPMPPSTTMIGPSWRTTCAPALGSSLPASDVQHVARRELHAVAVMPLQVGFEEVGGDEPGCLGRRPAACSMRVTAACSASARMSMAGVSPSMSRCRGDARRGERTGQRRGDAAARICKRVPTPRCG